MKVKGMVDKDRKPNDMQDDMDESAKRIYLDELSKAVVQQCELLPEHVSQFQFVERNLSESVDSMLKKGGKIMCGFPGCQKKFLYDGLSRKLQEENCKFKTSIPLESDASEISNEKKN